MSDPVLELHCGTDIVLLARTPDAGRGRAPEEDCALPMLMQALSQNLGRLRSGWPDLCCESVGLRQLSDEVLIDRVIADIHLGRLRATRRPGETFGFAMKKPRLEEAPPPPELPRQRVTPSMRAGTKPPAAPELPNPPKVPDVPKISRPDVPPIPDLPLPNPLPVLPELPDLPKVPDVPDIAALKDKAGAAAEQVANMEEFAKERAIANEMLKKAQKAREIARKVIELRNASKEEIAAFAMQLAADYGDDIPDEYREMLREYGTAENIKKAEDKAEQAADTAKGAADKF